MISGLTKKIAQQILAATIGIIGGAVVSIAPVALVQHKHLYWYFSNLDWQTKGFFAVCLLVGGLIAVHRIPNDKRANVQDSLENRWLIKHRQTLTIIYFFWYTASTALCQKIGLSTLGQASGTQMSTNLCFSTGCPIISTIGLFLLVLAAVIKLREKANYSSWLIFMTAVPLIFGVWLPLIALPGALIVIKWTGVSK